MRSYSVPAIFILALLLCVGTAFIHPGAAQVSNPYARRFQPRTADLSTSPNGTVWYRSDTDVVKVKLNSGVTTLNTSALSGSGANTRVAFWSGAGSLSSDSALTFSGGVLGSTNFNASTGYRLNGTSAFAYVGSTVPRLGDSASWTGIAIFAGSTEAFRSVPAGIQLAPVAFASLGTPSNGTVADCSDCTKATPCAGGSTGALAKRLNGAWDCD